MGVHQQDMILMFAFVITVGLFVHLIPEIQHASRTRTQTFLGENSLVGMDVNDIRRHDEGEIVYQIADATVEMSLTKEERATGIHIITTFYRGTYDTTRFIELLRILVANLKNKHVTGVHLLIQDRDPRQYLSQLDRESHLYLHKLATAYIGRQATYADLFQYANKVLSRGSIAIVTNADISFDATLSCLQNVTPQDPEFLTTNRTALVLSRHSKKCKGHDRPGKNQCFTYKGSHDSFVFAPPMINDIPLHLNFTQNHISAENVVTWELRETGNYTLTNPCRLVVGTHIHCQHAQRHIKKLSISRGRGRIGKINRHANVIPSKAECPILVY